jgi:TRAP-type C4-dicarboxylate transport system permease large subunit
MNLFVISALARDVPYPTIYRGVAPFIASEIVRVGLIIAFPSLSYWLVRTFYS